MGLFFVVVAQPLGQRLGALVRGAVGACIRPAAEHRADVALRLAVGLGPIGPGAQVPDLVSLERRVASPFPGEQAQEPSRTSSATTYS